MWEILLEAMGESVHKDPVGVIFVVDVREAVLWGQKTFLFLWPVGISFSMLSKWGNSLFLNSLAVGWDCTRFRSSMHGE